MSVKARYRTIRKHIRRFWLHQVVARLAALLETWPS